MDEAAINQVVAKNHISVSEAQAVALIKNADALKVDGKFSAERYEQFLRSQGKSDQQFVMEIRNDLAKEAVVSGVSATYPVPKALTEQFYEILTEERSVRTLVLPADDYLDKVAVTDEEIKAYYNAHLKDFLSPEHIKASTLSFRLTLSAIRRPVWTTSRPFTNKISSAGPFLKSAAQVIF